MKERIMKTVTALGLILALLLGTAGCGMLTKPAHNPVTDEDAIHRALVEHDFWYYDICGESDWYGDTTDGVRTAMAQELLAMFRALGYDTSRYTADKFAEAINRRYDRDKTLSVFETACAALRIDGSHYAGIYEAHAPKSNLLTDETEIFIALDNNYYWYYSNADVNSWYGTTTDAERIAMGAELLNLFNALGFDVRSYTPDTLAQAINDTYDAATVSSPSVFHAACALFGGDATLYESVYASGVLVDNPISGDGAICVVLDNHNYGYFRSTYLDDWEYISSDDSRAAWADDIISLFTELGYAKTMSAYDGETLAAAINDYYETVNSSLSLFETVCEIAGIEGSVYWDIYEQYQNEP